MAKRTSSAAAPARPSSSSGSASVPTSLPGGPPRTGSTRPTGRSGRSLQPPAHAQLVRAFSAQLAQYDPTGALVARSDDVTSMAREAAQRILDTAATWVDHLGAFYDTEGVQHLLSRDRTPISRQAVHKRRGLLVLTTGSGQVVYPAFQFDGKRPVPGLAPVLDALPEDVVSRWTVASWLVSPEADLDGERPIDVLREQGPEGQTAVMLAARRWAAQLAA